MIRVLVADDQDMVRSGFVMLLDAADDIEVVAQAADGIQAIALTERHRPDVVLLDIRMPRLDGLSALPRLTRTSRVVVVTTFEEDAYVDQALDGGASGFLLKDAGPELLLAGIRAAAAGDALISPGLTLRLLARRARRRADGPDVVDALSSRELEVAKLVAQGRTNQELCEELHISMGTVKTHLGSIQTRLGVRNRVEIAASLWRAGIMD